MTCQGQVGRHATELDWQGTFSGKSSVLSRPDLTKEIAESVTDLVENDILKYKLPPGWTPMVYLKNVLPDGCTARIAVKLESMNPLSSVKDRTALSLVEELERQGKITPGRTKLLEVTSGNTGLGLAFVAAVKGYQLICVMPEVVSAERKAVLLALGAELVLTAKEDGIPGVLRRGEMIEAADPNIVFTKQFDSAANPGIHYVTTGPEIWSQTQGKVDIFVAGSGTGGTVTGTGTFLKQKRPDIKIVALEPAESPFLSTGCAGMHEIQGIGPGINVATLDTRVLDDVVTVPSKEAIEMARRLAKEDGIFVGPSSGAAAVAAIKLAVRPENAGKLIVTVFPSFGERYLSTSTYQCYAEKAASLPVERLTEDERHAAMRKLGMTPPGKAETVKKETADPVATASSVVATS